MRSIQKQRGLTAISWMAIIVMIVFVAVIILKVAPIYLDSFKVNDVLTSFKEERNLADMTAGDIVSKAMKRLDINMVDDVQRNDISVENNGRRLRIVIDYEVRRNLFYNLDVVASFNKSIELDLR